MPKINTEQDIWNKADRSNGPDACWPWLKYRDHRGYGHLHFRGKQWVAHRLFFTFANGYTPEFVCHSCDNPPCCNPKHLWAGCPKTNAADMVKKGRAAKPRGERNPKSRLTAEQVLEIRSVVRSKTMTQAALAKKYGLTGVGIGLAVRGKSWGHLPYDAPAKVKRVTSSQKVEIKKLHEQGLSQRAIGATFGFSEATVSRVLYGRKERKA